MGPLENILGMLPGMSNVQGLSVDEKQLKRTEAIVLSMTNEERTRPDILNARRRQRIARGSGSTVTEVNDLLRRFDQMRKMMKNAGKMKKMMAQMARDEKLIYHVSFNQITQRRQRKTGRTTRSWWPIAAAHATGNLSRSLARTIQS